MIKKDAAIKQIERVLKELEMGKEESAATAVVGQNRENSNISGALIKLLFKFWGFRIFLTALLLVVIVFGVSCSFEIKSYHLK